MNEKKAKKNSGGEVKVWQRKSLFYLCIKRRTCPPRMGTSSIFTNKIQRASRAILRKNVLKKPVYTTGCR